jgi:hypothetical protein
MGCKILCPFTQSIFSFRCPSGIYCFDPVLYRDIIEAILELYRWFR